MADINRSRKKLIKRRSGRKDLLTDNLAKPEGAAEETADEVVSGYHFKSREAAQDAKDELIAIKYVSQKTDTKDPRQVFLLYNKLIDKGLFKTLIGLNYLRELQHFLYLSSAVPNEKIRPIPIDFELQEIIDGRRQLAKDKSSMRALERESRRYHDYFVRSLIVNIVLVLAVIAFILITKFSVNPNIMNYETNLQNKYAGWQEQLESQEASLKAREQELHR